MIANNLSDLLGRKVTRKDLYLKEVAIADGVENICEGLIRLKRLTTVTIPNSVKRISYRAFWCCHNLTSLVIPESVKEIHPFAFGHCENLKFIEVNNNNKHFDSREGCNAIISTRDNVLILGCDFSTIPNGVKRIKSDAFRDCQNIKSIVIPESLHNVIYGLPSKEKIISIEVNKQNTYLDSREGCNAIIRTKDNTLLYGCSNSTIPEGIEVIEKSAFAGCNNLLSIVIPDSVKTIGRRAFYGCRKLSSITIPNNITTIGESAFTNCSRNKIFYIPKGSRKKYEMLLSRYKSPLVEI